MNDDYKVTVLKHNQLWCEIAINRRNATAVLSDIAVGFPKAAGFSYTLFKKSGENRILSADAQGIRLIGVEASYTLASPSDLTCCRSFFVQSTTEVTTAPS
ncbi:hypothetical protein [Motilimonas eburnea]|uniref:hypothetical protein n=1 Tax=Motilimonas eburnea TaxID=1737488 RepID=UPI001E456D4A|nr:hypothetical protein [Motilimonas eburnea]MCE2572962.1 hypothetical protein [Motilimonas eburnea]